MTEAEFNQTLAKGNVGYPNTPQAQPQQQEQQPDFSVLLGFIPVLQQLRTTASFRTTAPAFIPKTFLDQIQFYDDGTHRRVYFYFNKTWSYTSLT